MSGRSRGHRITGLWESLGGAAGGGGAAGAGRGRWPGELAAARLPRWFQPDGAAPLLSHPPPDDSQLQM